MSMVDMIDCAVGFLGPDLDPFVADLLELGGRHYKYGVRPEFFRVMGQALFFALYKFLGDNFSMDDRSSWENVFNFMVHHMEKGYYRKAKEAQ